MKRRHFLTLTGCSLSLITVSDAGVFAGDKSQIPKSLGKFTFTPNPQKKHQTIEVWTCQPQNLQPNSPIAIVMTGIKRNARDYRNTWAPYSQQNNFLLLVPEFPADLYPSDVYNEGNIRDRQRNPIPQSEWTFTILEQLFDYVRTISGNQSEKYYLYGHSAGGQFVHRFVLFMPEARYQRAIAANPGFYTFPTPDVAYPYGLEGTPLQTGIPSTVFERDFVLMLGGKDTNRNDLVLRKTPQADRQGLTRFERGMNYFSAVLEVAKREEVKFNWKLVKVPGVGHSDSGMARSAAEILFA
jgi:hypothetical protein